MSLRSYFVRLIVRLARRQRGREVPDRREIGTLVDEDRTCAPKGIVYINVSSFRSKNIGHLRERRPGRQRNVRRHEPFPVFLDELDQIFLARLVKRHISVTGKEDRIDVVQVRAAAGRGAVGLLRVVRDDVGIGADIQVIGARLVPDALQHCHHVRWWCRAAPGHSACPPRPIPPSWFGLRRPVLERELAPRLGRRLDRRPSLCPPPGLSLQVVLHPHPAGAGSAGQQPKPCTTVVRSQSILVAYVSSSVHLDFESTMLRSSAVVLSSARNACSSRWVRFALESDEIVDYEQEAYSNQHPVG